MVAGRNPVTVDSVVAGGVVVVALAAFKMVQFIIAKQQNGKDKKTSVPPSPDHGPCREAVKELTIGLYSFLEESKANLVEQRTFRTMFGEWMAREEGRREAARDLARTGEHPAYTPPRGGFDAR